MTRAETAGEDLSLRPLVVGAGGLVGAAIAERFERRFPWTVSATRAELDLTDRWRLAAELERLRPDLVVNAAAMSNVDACEEDPEAAMRVNAVGPRDLARACDAIGARLIHLSTDYVFDGRKGSEYDEADDPAPVNVYGESKLVGELGVLETLAPAVVLRISFVFGPGRPTFLDHLAARLRDPRGGPVAAVDGWRTRPTSAGAIAAAVERLAIDTDASGVWHFACPPAVTRYAFAREVARLVGADPERVTPQTPADLALAAARPEATPLSTRRWQERYGEHPPTWVDEARDYLASEGGGA